MMDLLAVLLLLPLALATSTCPTSPSKRGLGWTYSYRNGSKWAPQSGFNFENTTISAYYTWNPDPVPDSAFPFVPMLWGCEAKYSEAWDQAVKDEFRMYTAEDGSRKKTDAPLTSDRAVLAFNEPTIASQSNCSPVAAAQVWINHIEPLKAKGYRLGTPAVTMAPEGRAWMKKWLEACAGRCNPDSQAVHWYDVDLQSLQDTLNGHHDEFGLPIWLTEFAVHDYSNTKPAATLANITKFMADATNWLDSTEWVERYFWYGAMYSLNGINPLNTLLDGAGARKLTGALNPLGEQYAGGSGNVSDPIKVKPCGSISAAQQQAPSVGAVVVAVAAVLGIMAAL